VVFTARCYADRGNRALFVVSVHPSVALVDCDHSGWNSSKIISRLDSLGCSLSADPNNVDLIQRKYPEILAEIREGIENVDFGVQNPCL